MQKYLLAKIFHAEVYLRPDQIEVLQGPLLADFGHFNPFPHTAADDWCHFFVCQNSFTYNQ